MEMVGEMKFVKHYPTVEEILNEDRRRRCTDCGREFHNSSACRFHALKQHDKEGMPDTNESRILRRTATGQVIIRRFFCPDPSCSDKPYDGLRYVRQHYIRKHVEKKLICEHCGLRLAMPKDMNYHIKARCVVLRKQRAIANGEVDKPKPKKKITGSRARKQKNHQTEESETSSNFLNSPIVLIVSPENAHRVLETVRTALRTSGLDGLDVLRNPQPGVFAEASTQVQMPYLDNLGDDVPLFATASTSTSFETQFDPEPVTFCERGTMMTEEEPLSYFSPPYGEEFGDINPQEKQQSFDFSSSAPSTSSQPQTRSFGTMFENVTTCNAGTSMIDEAFPDFLRDIHTQTPNGVMGSSSSDPSSVNWPWTDGI